MGVLEDAIREHLELKRKHGASDDELEEQEAEALGPARREFAAEAESEAVEEAPAPLDEVEAVEEPLLEEPLVEEPPPEEPPPEEPAPPVPQGDTQVHEQLHPEPEVPPARAEEEEEPDFQQEAPDDDRLWHEQRPPRDFDFD